jgi:uncharacterized protein (DUF1800 family)
MNDVKTIDPQWAWTAYRPTAERPWDHRLAAHLFRRAGFGASLPELNAAVEQDPSEVVAKLLTPVELQQSTQAAFAEAVLAGGDPRQLGAWWVYVMLQTPTPLLEKMTLFWHGHFATSADKVTDARAMYAQNTLLRAHAIGDFRPLVHGISRDPAMLIYLDSSTNRKAHPNENFARELMELFCLGEGHYSERDVKELARCFTGWELRREKFRFNRYQHDTGDKTVLGKTGRFQESEVIDHILDQRAAPEFIARKWIRYFVSDEPEPSEQLVAPIAGRLRESAWNIGDAIQHILQSNLFFSSQAIARKIRSPVDLTVGLMRSLEGSTNATQLAVDLQELGQGLFFPPNVKGWDGGRTWINSSTLLGRANVIGRLVRDPKTRFGGGDLTTYFGELGAESNEQIVDILLKLTVAITVPTAVKSQLVEVVGRPGERNARIAETIHALGTLPEFQIA